MKFMNERNNCELIYIIIIGDVNDREYNKYAVRVNNKPKRKFQSPICIHIYL